MEPLQMLSATSPAPRRRKPSVVIGIIFVLAIATALGIGVAWIRSYDNRIAPNIFIGTVAVGGLSSDAAKILVQHQADQLLGNGLALTLNGTQPTTLPLNGAVGGDVIEDATLDVNSAVTEALTIDHEANPLRMGLALLEAWQKTQTVPVPVALQESPLEQSLTALYPDASSPGQASQFEFSEEAGVWSAKTTNGTPGQTFDTTQFLNDVQNRLSTLSAAPIDVTLMAQASVVDATKLETVSTAAAAAMQQAPYVFTYGSGKTAEHFSVDADLLGHLLAPAADGSLHVNDLPLRAAVAPFALTFEMKPNDAQFVLVDNRVTTFVPSQEGMEVDVDTMVNQLQALVNRAATLAPQDKTIPLPIVTVEPNLTTAASNSLGINQLLGTGTSNYSGSTYNRLINIKNGVNLLNGLLIAPGDTFSTVQALGPFTTDHGYVPELVIKGDSIVPELGGGLCQIGTTEFRTIMNSGLPVAERYNHSLVVSHYNDPSNGNPGTDATIYDPEPDLKFTNDTGHYILFVAQMIPETTTLSFSFWGTSDGRQGSYSPPQVLRWIPYGPEEDTPSTSIPVGKKSCQNPIPGADTTFDYTIVKPDGTSVVETFNSHYRALPKICLVGEDPATVAATSATAKTNDATGVPD